MCIRDRYRTWDFCVQKYSFVGTCGILGLVQQIGIWRLLEMTEREKMLSGERYDPTDKELEQLRLNARKLTRKYIHTSTNNTITWFAFLLSEKK